MTISGRPFQDFRDLVHSMPDAADEAVGSWKHPDNGAIVSFYACDQDLCAKILKASEPGLKDSHNPDAGKRDQLLEGLVILDHAKKTGDADWSGNLYNTQDGKTYTGHVSLLSPSQLQLKGCALVVFCKSIVFTREAAQ